MLKAQTGKSHESLHIIVLAPYAWRHASRSAGSLLSTCLDDSNDTTIFRSGQTSINTRRKISRSRQTKTLLKNHRQILHLLSEFNVLTDRHLENWVIVNSALTLAYMIHGFRVLWPLKYLWHLVGSGCERSSVHYRHRRKPSSIVGNAVQWIAHTHTLHTFFRNYLSQRRTYHWQGDRLCGLCGNGVSFYFTCNIKQILGSITTHTHTYRM